MTTTVRSAWAGPGARRALAVSRTGRVATLHRTAAYLELTGGWVLVAGAREPRGPLTLTVDRLPAGTLAPGDPVAVSSAELRAGTLRIALDGAWSRAHADATAVGAAGTVAPPAARAHAARAALAQCQTPPPELHDGLDALGDGAHGRAVRLLAGVGDGLTPAGDDALAGYAAWRHALDGRAPALADAAAPRTSPLSLAYLRCAEHGELAEPAARTLRAVRAGDADAAAARARTLRRWGATSGSALMWGIAVGASVPAATVAGAGR